MRSIGLFLRSGSPHPHDLLEESAAAARVTPTLQALRKVGKRTAVSLDAAATQNIRNASCFDANRCPNAQHGVHYIHLDHHLAPDGHPCRLRDPHLRAHHALPASAPRPRPAVRRLLDLLPAEGVQVDPHHRRVLRDWRRPRRVLRRARGPRRAGRPPRWQCVHKHPHFSGCCTTFFPAGGVCPERLNCAHPQSSRRSKPHASPKVPCVMSWRAT